MATAFRDVIFNTKLGGIGQAANSARTLGTGFQRANRGMRQLTTQAGVLAGRMKGVATGFLSIKGILLGAGFARVVGFFSSMVTALEEQEAAQVRLATALRASGNFTAEAFANLQEYARGLQQVTAFGDEAILSMQGMLATFKATPEQIRELTPAILDMSAATGVALDQVAIMIGKALTGQIGGLRRVGVDISRAAFEADGFRAIIKELNSEFGGMAQAMAQTPVGQLRQLKNLWGDMKEEMGKAIVESGAFNALMDTLREGMDQLKGFLAANPDFLGNLFATGVSALKGFISLMPGLLGLIASAVEHAKELLSVWLAIKGAMAGAQLGGAFGPIGSAIGAVIGGGAGFFGGQYIGGRLEEARREAMQRTTFTPTFERTGGAGGGGQTNINIENRVSAPINVQGAGELGDEFASLRDTVIDESVRPLDELGGEFRDLATEIKMREKYGRTV
jgi:hypothetical protein